MIWNKMPIEKVGHSTFKYNEDVYDKSTNLQNDFTDKTEISKKILSDLERVTHQKN